MFTNVFVQRWAYNEFANSGEVAREVHVRDRRTGFGKPKFINRKGHYQTDVMGLVVEVKDSARNPDHRSVGASDGGEVKEGHGSGWTVQRSDLREHQNIREERVAAGRTAG